MADWNMSWAQWLAGDAAPTPEAQALHPKLPHDAEPAAPAPTPTTTATPRPTPRPTATATPTHH
jgi:hypothetical protein